MVARNVLCVGKRGGRGKLLADAGNDETGATRDSWARGAGLMGAGRGTHGRRAWDSWAQGVGLMGAGKLSMQKNLLLGYHFLWILVSQEELFVHR